MSRKGNKMPARRIISFGNLLSSIRSTPRRDENEDNDAREPYSRMRHAIADFTEAEDDEEEEEEDGEEDGDEDDHQDEDRHGRRDSGTILPLFSESHLDSLPVYSITHAIRVIVQSRSETTLTWEQLRSPQVSQFLVKPMQVQIRQQHFSRATIYALMANCLQFAKEGQINPGNFGTSSTRAKVCELLAIKLLKEYSTRELIDALSYDFYPLQGIPGVQTPMTPLTPRDGKAKAAAARTSTLEVAIRASAKHFLAHPLVVQQLEGIWNGAISFYSSADNLHRQSIKSTAPSPIARTPLVQNDSERTPLLQFQKGLETISKQPPVARRTVTLYDPRNASMFKLSRLRVPRYRQFFSTCSLAILIGLFLAVLIQRSNPITSLELIFWFWSAGFMLDELVGFTEQGFSLYIMSFWNIFDLGILMLLIIYYCMRIYTVFLVGSHDGVDAYDILAANAVLLLPRIFSVLDHYPYFSQIILAMKIMSVDLAAVFVLIFVSCSGFFVFFLANTKADAGEVAYKIFQILMGFTPAAWDVWPSYSWLDRTLMCLFLIICHFVVVTVLITVLTNSFMSIASNAKEEHQFLFAINTIAMVKDQSLFSYVAPGNIFAWVLMPFRYFMPLRHFVWLNRTIIKFTHFPLLWLIFLYEKYVLAPSMYEPTDFVDNPGRGRTGALSINHAGRPSLFSPTIRIRDESVAGFQQDRALEEVFRRTPDFASLRTHRMNERNRTHNNVRNWMDRNDDIPELPIMPRGNSGTQQDWGRKLSLVRDGPPRRRRISENRSIASDPAEHASHIGLPFGADGYFDGVDRQDHAERRILKDQDADDELVTNDEDDDEGTAPSRQSNAKSDTEGEEGEDYFKTPVAGRFNENFVPTSLDTTRSPLHQQVTRQKRNGLHSRTLSTNTILFNPMQQMAHRISDADLEVSPGNAAKTRARLVSNRQTPVGSPRAKSPRRTIPAFTGVSSRPRPILPNRDTTHSTANIHREGLRIDTSRPRRGKARRMSSSDLLDIQSDLGGVANDDAFGGVPSSFVTQMAMATGMITPANRAKDKAQRDRDNDDRDRMSRLVLARMKTLEEGFAEVVNGMRVLQQTSGFPSTAHNSARGSASEGTGSISWAGDNEVNMRPFTALHEGGRVGGSRAKAESSGRPGSSRRSGDKSSNRNSVILRSPIGSAGARLKGKYKDVADMLRPQKEQQRQETSDSDSDIGTFGGVERNPPTRRRGSSF